VAPVGQTTLLALIQAAADLADQPTPSTTTYISKARWTEWVNAACQELYDKLIEAYAEDYYVASEQTITTDGTNSTFTLNDAFYKLLGVDLLVNANAGESGRRTIWRYNFAERNQYTLPGLAATGQQVLRYRLQGTYKIAFLPRPPVGGQTIYLTYAPRFTPLSADADTFDGINGWEEWVKAAVAMKALGKEESDMSPAMALLQRQEARLESIKAARDVGAPSTTVDVYAVNGGRYGWSGDGL
jgi:hypothetical protein